jgi:hypothetical protein
VPCRFFGRCKIDDGKTYKKTLQQVNPRLSGRELQLLQKRAQLDDERRKDVKKARTSAKMSCSQMLC